MADIDIPQDEADALIQMEKRRSDDRTTLFPAPGERLTVSLTSLDKRENFNLDITRAQIKLTKATYQNRARQAIMLMRPDLDGPPHRNPDGPKSPVPTFTLTAKVSVTSGPSRHRRTAILMLPTFSELIRLSWPTATSQTRRGSRKVSSHERRRDRRSAPRLSRVVEG